MIDWLYTKAVHMAENNRPAHNAHPCLLHARLDEKVRIVLGSFMVVDFF